MKGLKSKPERKRRDESGQALILFALGLAVLLGMAALTIDVGLAYVARRDMQNAADAA
ncbi:MAG: pilus assembly protein TadG-related protein, partial [Dehalococcoidia bacterium]